MSGLEKLAIGRYSIHIGAAQLEKSPKNVLHVVHQQKIEQKTSHTLTVRAFCVDVNDDDKS